MSAVVKARMLRVLRHELSAQDFQASRYCEGQLKMLVGQGVSRLRLNNAIEDASLILRAESSLRSLVRYFSQYSKDVGTFPSLSNTQFNTALNECPTFWPFRS